MDGKDIVYVGTHGDLEAAFQLWRTKRALGIDLECENNLHHYGAYITLIQISDGKKVWIVDVLSLGDIKPVLELFTNAAIQKVFHDVSFDLRILSHQFHCVPRSIFDTQIAALFLGMKEVGLGALLAQFFEVKKQQKFQMADWTKRPISREMMEYAAHDAVYLLALRDLLQQELQRKGRLDWVEEECALLEKKKWDYTEGGYASVKGFSLLSPQQRAVFKELYELRDTIARQVDRPVHFVVTNARLKECAVRPPDWRNLRGVHPAVRRHARDFETAIRNARGKRIDIPFPERKRMTQKQKEMHQHIAEVRDSIATELGMPRHLFLSQEQMIELATSGSKDCLKEWQQKILGTRI